MFYGPFILKKAGFTDGNLLNLVRSIFLFFFLMSAQGIGGWNFITTLVAVILVKKVGRRALMIFGTALMTLALIGIGLTFTLTVEEACNQTAIPVEKRTTWYVN